MIQVSCTPPNIDIQQPMPQVTEDEDTDVSLTFTPGISPIAPSTFEAFHNNADNSSEYTVTASGASTNLVLEDGGNHLSFRVSGTDGQT